MSGGQEQDNNKWCSWSVGPDPLSPSQRVARLECRVGRAKEFVEISFEERVEARLVHCRNA